MTEKASNLQAKDKKELASTAEQTKPGPVFTPYVDIFETEDSITLLADLPGVTAGDLDIDLHDDTLTIVGNFHQTAGFFDSLQNLLRVVKVTTFKMDMQPAVKIVINEDGEKEQEKVKALQTKITANTFAYIEGSEKVK